MFLFDILETVFAYDLVKNRIIKKKEVILNGTLMIKAEESN